MADSDENGQKKISVDVQKVINAYQRQITVQSNDIAIKEAMIEMQAEEITQLKTLLNEKIDVSSNGKTSKKVDKE